MLARSTQGIVDSRLKAWQLLCQDWGVPPFPVTVDALRKVGAAMAAAGYTSIKLYFQAAFLHQETTLQVEVTDLLRRTARRIHRARHQPGDVLYDHLRGI